MTIEMEAGAPQIPCSTKHGGCTLRFEYLTFAQQRSFNLMFPDRIDVDAHGLATSQNAARGLH